MKKLLLLLFLIASTANAADVNDLSLESYRTFGTAGGFSDFDIDESGDKLEAIFPAPVSCAIDTILFRYGSRTGTTPINRVSIQGVATTGRADGTIKNATNAKATFNPPEDATWDGTVRSVALGATYTPSKGELIAIVIDDDPVDGATINGANKSSYSYTHGGYDGRTIPWNFTFNNTGSVATRTGVAAPIGYKCGSAVYGNPMLNLTNGGFASDSGVDERGNIFSGQYPAGSCSTFTVTGACYILSLNATSSDYEVNLMNGTTETDQVTIDGDQTGTGAGIECIFFPTGGTFSCGDSDVGITIRPTTTNGMTLGELTVSSAGDMDAYPGGTNVYAIGRADNTGSYTATTTKRYSVWPIISDVTATAGGLRNQNTVSGGSQ